jgi:hypothetical protein
MGRRLRDVRGCGIGQNSRNGLRFRANIGRMLIEIPAAASEREGNGRANK